MNGIFGSKSCGAALLVALLSQVPTKAIAQPLDFNCGREHHERIKDPGEAWYALYFRRAGLAVALENNGNWDLAARFRECALTALRRAAEFGYREAQYQYALRLALRKPQTPETKAETYEWMRKAALQGHERAKLLLKTYSRP